MQIAIFRCISRISGGLAVFSCLLAWPVQAGVLIVEKTENIQGGELSTSKVFINPDSLRAESTSSTGQQSIFLYRADTQSIYLINTRERNYQQMTRQEMEEIFGLLGDQMAQMRQVMEEQMKDMPPQQREMFEKMMKGKMGGPSGSEAPAAQITYRRVGTGEPVGQWTTDRYEAFLNNAKVQELWTTDWRQFGLTIDDFLVFRDLVSMLSGLASRFSMEMPPVGMAESGSDSEFSGIPVRRITFQDGKPVMRHEVIELSRQEFEASLFQVPEGYRRTESPLPRK